MYSKDSTTAKLMTSCIVRETCSVIWEEMRELYMPRPNRELWMNSAKRFEDRWNFPHCIGALDGKHIVIQAPPNTGSEFHSYKGTFSVVLLALVDADHRFLAVDIGAFGSNSDGGIFANSQLGKALQADTLDVPPPSHLRSAPELGPLPHVIVADEAFPMKPYLLRPYPGRHLQEDLRIFNYRLSRARRIVENCFGILTQRWRVYCRRIQVCPEVVDSIIKATCILHNFLHSAEGDQNPDDDEPGEEVGESILAPIRNLRGNRASAEALRVRDAFHQYFNSPAGQVPWQYAHVRRGLAS
uniref:DDE Tnp4 domain-containing protein n=1 Tax=Acanthochromis polyacanthus TaxID=80966 RepID=A0A3Q1GW95_9TELE